MEKMDKLLKELRTAATGDRPSPETLTALADESPERAFMDAHSVSGNVPDERGEQTLNAHAARIDRDALICDRASGDGRWNNRWPKQIRAA